MAELAEVVGAPHEARFIVDEVLGLGLVLGHPDPPTGALHPDAVAAARRLAARRAAGEPLQYVFGHWPFRSLDLLVDPRVLIPRPETEQVVEVALAEARRLARDRGVNGDEGLVAVDAGTGSGAVALALAAELGRRALREVWATDASADALGGRRGEPRCVARRPRGGPAAHRARPGELARAASRLGCAAPWTWSSPTPRTSRRRSGMVCRSRCAAEPRQALVAGPGRDGSAGLAEVEAVLVEAWRWLARPGTAVVELAPDQAAPAVELARRLGFDDVRVEPDLARRPRALVARVNGEAN